MISIKKVGIVVATAGLLAASAVPAFASDRHDHGDRNSNSTTINQSNDGSVNNDVSVNANTGFNTGTSSSRHHHGDSENSSNDGGSGVVNTGDAAAAALVGAQGGYNEANTSCGCDGRTTVNQSNDGSVNNDVSVNANTGFNRGGSVRTGDAFAGASVSAVGGTNIVTQ